MTEILALWLAVGFICFSFGAGVFKFLRINTSRIFELTAVGYCVLIVLTSYVSLFVPVNRSVLYVLLALAVVFLIVTKCWRVLVTELSIQTEVILTVVLLAFFSVMTFAFIDQEWDTLAYHAQAVRWINEYGAVKGIANLMVKIGFNNSIFCLYALGASGLFGSGCHSMLGFTLWIFGAFFAEAAIVAIKNKRYDISVYAFAILAYLIVNAKVGSTYLTDYAANSIAAFVLVEWISCDKYKDIAKKCMLCVCIIVLATVKMSMAPMIILAIEPIVQLSKKKKYSGILTSSIVCFVAGLHYLIRNYIVSGWLLYPTTKLDLFDVEWKVSATEARAQELWIYSWGRIHNADFNETIYCPPFSWVPKWFLSQTVYFKCVIVISVIGLLILGGLWVVNRKRRVNQDSNIGRYIAPYLASWIVLVYWFVTAPDVRFVIAPLLFVVYMPIVQFVNNNLRVLQIIYFAQIMTAMFSVMTFFSYIANGENVMTMFSSEQEDLPHFDEGAVELYAGDVTFYAFDFHGLAPGNHELPCMFIPGGEIRLLGDDISDGFGIVHY